MPRIRYLRPPASFTTTFQRITSAFVIVVVAFNVYRRLLLDIADPYKCNALLTQGQWVDSPDRNPEREPFLNWQVPGCMLHEYQAHDIARCNEAGKILFVGDTGTRQVFWAAVRRLEGGRQWVDKEQQKRDVHVDLEYSRDGANLKFLWDPYLNSSQLHAELTAFRGHGKSIQKRNEDGGGQQEKDTSTQKSVLIFIGGGLWYARHVLSDTITYYKATVDKIIATAYGDNATMGFEPLSPFGADGVGNQIFFAPVLEPLYDELSPSRALTITPSKIIAMNKYLAEQSDYGLNVLWSFPQMTRGWRELYGSSGLHVSQRVAARMADVALNLRCNGKAVQQEGYPFDKTCCSPYRPFNWLQILGMIASIVVLQELVYKAVKGTSDNPTDQHNKNSSISLSSLGLPTIVLTIAYCFIADRTQIFEKVGKEFSNLDFRVLIGLTILPCLLGIKNIPVTSTARHPRSSKAPVFRPFLPRELSEEFKGWMQLYVLIYGYTGADVYLDFYEVLRIFLSLYLFFSGYGHTMFFLQTGDYSLLRVATVLLRLNTLPVLLSFGMARPYSSYYFAPLVSFWFLVVYATLKRGSGRNDSLQRVIIRIAVSALLMAGFVHIQGILESLASVLRLISRANVNVEEWRHHLATDLYIVYVGMLIATLNIHLTMMLNTPKDQLSSTAEVICSYFSTMQGLVILTALIEIPVFWVLTRQLRSNAEYDFWMPYISWVPALSFVVLRNGTKFLRSYYCAPFVWISRISLELYLLSNHIWLAGDGRGLLRVGFRNGDGSFFGDRWRDLLILTPIFVWVAWKVSDATKTLTNWIMGTESRSEVAAANQSTGDGMELSPMDQRSPLPKPSTQSDTLEGPKLRDCILGIPASLKWRLLAVMAILWICNILYT